MKNKIFKHWKRDLGGEYVSLHERMGGKDICNCGVDMPYTLNGIVDDIAGANDSLIFSHTEAQQYA